MQIYIVYKVTNLVNNKYYIGVHKTDNINDGYLGSGVAIRNAIKKYGVKNFKKEIIDIFFEEKNAYKKEAILVTEEEASCKTCYNIKPGGYGGFSYINSNKLNWQHSNREASIKNLKLGTPALQKKLKEPEFNKQFCKSVSNGLKNYFKENPSFWIGKKHTEASKNKMREIHKEKKHQQGSKNSQYGTIWITNDVETKKIPKDSIIPDGWRRGRKKKIN